MSSVARSIRLFKYVKPSRWTQVATRSLSLNTPGISLGAAKHRLLVPTHMSNLQIRLIETKAPLTLKELEDRITLVIKSYDKIDSSKITSEAHFMKDLGLDSLDHVEVMMALEDEFGYEIPDRVAEGLMTPNDILKFFMDKMNVKT